MSERNIRWGGLYRCCVQSIQEYKGEEVPGQTVIGCRYHKDKDEAIAKLAADGTWEWIGNAREIKGRANEES